MLKGYVVSLRNGDDSEHSDSSQGKLELSPFPTNNLNKHIVEDNQRTLFGSDASDEENFKSVA